MARNGLTGEIIADPSRLTPPWIRWVDHFSWPWMVAMGFEGQADDLIPRNTLAPLDEDDAIYIPGLRGVFIFENEKDKFVWYAQANMVALDGKLYHVVFQEGNLLAAYAWLMRRQKVDAAVMLIAKTNLTWHFPHNNVLQIRGSTIDRYTGEMRPQHRAAYVNCIQMIPPVQWWQAPKTYFDDLWKVYAPQDHVTHRLLKLQTTMKKWSQRKKTDRLNKLRNVGWLSVLNDDLYERVMELAFRSTSLRPIRTQLELETRVHHEEIVLA